MPLHRTRSFIVALGAALAIVPAGGAMAADPGPYVALGDSYTAAPLVPNQVGKPVGCLRSDHNYPSLVARALAIASFRDVSCSGAETKDMTSSQSVSLGRNAPQLDALRDTTRLVTLGIGGNDVGLVGAAVTCAVLGIAAPTGSACRTHYASPSGDRLGAAIAATAPKVAAVLAAIHARSPLARVAVVGYPDVLPRSGNGCYPLVPLSPDDVRYFDGLIVQMNAMLARQAAAGGAEFVDTYDDSVGHDVCTLPGTRWFEGLVPTSLSFPLHPNALGMQSMARSVLRVLATPRPGPVLSRLARGRRSIALGATARIAYRVDRDASLRLVLLRATAGRLRGASCRVPSASNRTARPCDRYVVARRLTVAARRGDGTLSLRPADYRRRAGLYRLVVTPAGADGVGAAGVVRFRVRRR